VLFVGASGPRVRRVQQALRVRGFVVAVDGAYGPRTRLAVARLQRRLGLPVNGAVDGGLLRRLGAGAPHRLAAFPVQGPHSFIDDFGAPRHQGPHEGTDIVAVRGAPVVAVADGAIEQMTRVERGLGGIWVRLRADEGTAYYYAHLSAIAPGLAPGVRVAAGQQIGGVGRTGDARGGVHHLHFEIHPGGGPRVINPYRALRAVDPV
jgi:murein DD-endopeptidase MepM/ murein hydrolase activator NlpD